MGQTHNFFINKKCLLPCKHKIFISKPYKTKFILNGPDIYHLLALFKLKIPEHFNKYNLAIRNELLFNILELFISNSNKRIDFYTKMLICTFVVALIDTISIVSQNKKELMVIYENALYFAINRYTNVKFNHGIDLKYHDKLLELKDKSDALFLNSKKI